jgi:hypothetical protein
LTGLPVASASKKVEQTIKMLDLIEKNPKSAGIKLSEIQDFGNGDQYRLAALTKEGDLGHMVSWAYKKADEVGYNKLMADIKAKNLADAKAILSGIKSIETPPVKPKPTKGTTPKVDTKEKIVSNQKEFEKTKNIIEDPKEIDLSQNKAYKYEDVKQKFGHDGTLADDLKLRQAWVERGWRPGKPIPDDLLTISTEIQKKTPTELITQTELPDRSGFYKWDEVKQSFGSTGTEADNLLLKKAWLDRNAVKDPETGNYRGWRPGDDVPPRYRTQKYKKDMGFPVEDLDPLKWSEGDYDIKNPDLNKMLVSYVKQNTNVIDRIKKWWKDLWSDAESLMEECKQLSTRLKEGSETDILVKQRIQKALDDKLKILYKKSHNNFVNMREFFDEIASKDSNFKTIWDKIKNDGEGNFWSEFGVIAKKIDGFDVWWRGLFGDFKESFSTGLVSDTMKGIIGPWVSKKISWTDEAPKAARARLRTIFTSGTYKGMSSMTNAHYKDLIQKYGIRSAQVRYFRDLLLQKFKLNLAIGTLTVFLEYVGDAYWSKDLRNCAEQGDLCNLSGQCENVKTACEPLQNAGWFGGVLLNWAIDFRNGDPQKDTDAIVRWFEEIFSPPKFKESFGDGEWYQVLTEIYKYFGQGYIGDTLDTIVDVAAGRNKIKDVEELEKYLKGQLAFAESKLKEADQKIEEKTKVLKSKLKWKCDDKNGCIQAVDGKFATSGECQTQCTTPNKEEKKKEEQEEVTVEGSNTVEFLNNYATENLDNYSCTKSDKSECLYRQNNFKVNGNDVFCVANKGNETFICFTYIDKKVYLQRGLVANATNIKDEFSKFPGGWEVLPPKLKAESINKIIKNILSSNMKIGNRRIFVQEVEKRFGVK